MQDAPAEGDLVLLLLELMDHGPQVVVVESREVGKGFHVSGLSSLVT